MPTKTEPAEYLTTAQAAEMIGVSSSRVRQLVLEGRLTAKKIGRDLLLIQSVVEDFLEKPRKRTGRPSKD